MTVEGRHTGAHEWWYLDGRSADGTVGVATEFYLDAHSGHGRFWFVAAHPEGAAVVVDAGFQVPERGLEIRTTGLWFEYRSQHDRTNFTVDLEAFGLGVEPDITLDASSYGVVTPVGCELEWESSIDDWPPVDLDAPDGAYRIDAAVDGVVLVGADEYGLSGLGRRIHRWSTEPFVPDLDDGPIVRQIVAITGESGADSPVEFGFDAHHRWSRFRPASVGERGL